MPEKTKDKKEKKIVFSEKIDSMINGYALGLTCIGVGIFLLLKPSYFFSPSVSYIIGALIGAFGVMGTGIELDKSSKIKGFGNITIGLVVFAVWLVLYVKIKILWVNIISFGLLVFGCYGTILGIIQGIYSIVRNTQVPKSDSPNKKSGSVICTLLSQTILFLTQLCGLMVAILNVIKAFNG